jgi:hypothetical protein
MIVLSEKVKMLIPYLVGIILIIYLLKPNIFFKPNGKTRIYGLGYDDQGYKKTLYTFQFAIIIIVLMLYIVLMK